MDTDGVVELYSAPLTGTQVSAKLNATPVLAGNVEAGFALSPDGAWVVYRADQDLDEVFELYSAPIDGSQAALKLNVPLSGLQDVSSTIAISPDSSSVVYAADQAVNSLTELYVVPIDAQLASTKLNVAGRVLIDFEIDPSGNRVVYRGVEDLVNPIDIDELFSVLLDASQSPIKLHGALALGSINGDILEYHLTSDGSRGVYQSFDNPGNSLFIVEIEDVPCPDKLVGTYQFTSISPGFAVTADDLRVVYFGVESAATVQQLFSFPIDGSSGPVQLNGPLVPAGRLQEFQVSSDGSWVVYLADQDVDNVLELYTAPISVSMSSMKLNGPLVAGGNVLSFSISPDGSRVVYLADQDADTIDELYSVPIDASSSPVKLNGPLVLFGRVQDFLFSPDGSLVVYRADEETQNEFELYSVPTDGTSMATKLSGPLASGGAVQPDYQVTPDGITAAYRAFQDTNFAIELYSVPLDGSAASIKISPPLVNQGNVGEFVISPDSALVAFVARATSNVIWELFSVPIDRSQEPTQLSGSLTVGSAGLPSISPDSAWVVYFSRDSQRVLEIYSVPIDGSVLPAKLNVPISRFRNIEFFAISSDSNRVVYWGDQDVEGEYEIYSAPIDASSAPLQLNAPLVAGGDVQLGIEITPDAKWAIYRADQDTDEVFELYFAPLDGSQAAQRLSHPLILPKLRGGLRPRSHIGGSLERGVGN